jgi:hypothetical protein
MLQPVPETNPPAAPPRTSPPPPAATPSPPLATSAPVATAMVRVGDQASAFRPAGSSRATVESYRTDAHAWLQEDTWESVSRKHFLTERYAEALRAFSQQNPQVNDRVRQDGRPAPGDTVFIPPAWVLEKYHSPLIRPAQPAGMP